MAPGVCLIVAATPSFLGEATILSVLGQLTVIPAPGPFFHAALTALKCCVNTKIVPLLSGRRTTLIAVTGRVTPGFALAMTGSFHFVSCPKKMWVYASRDSLRSFGPLGRL